MINNHFLPAYQSKYKNLIIAFSVKRKSGTLEARATTEHANATGTEATKLNVPNTTEHANAQWSM
jgi:hypothetical protein